MGKPKVKKTTGKGRSKKSQQVQFEHEVEAILDKKYLKQETYYYIKWKGCSEASNSWEPEEHLDCKELVTTFENLRSQNKIGFERGLSAEQIVGCTTSGAQLFFLVKWKDTDLCDLIESKEANDRCPDLVHQFYEDRMTWDSEPKTYEGDEEEEDYVL